MTKFLSHTVFAYLYARLISHEFLYSNFPQISYREAVHAFLVVLGISLALAWYTAWALPPG